MEFDTRGWSDEQRTALIKKLESEGYRKGLPNATETGKLSITTYTDGTYYLYDEMEAIIEHLTTYEEYMGEAQQEPTQAVNEHKPRQVVLTQPVADIVSVDDVLNSKFYGAIAGDGTKMLFYQVGGRYTWSHFSGLLENKALMNDSLTDIITEVLNRHRSVYEFDTSKELLEWLSN